jgi:hypothetical protein
MDNYQFLLTEFVLIIPTVLPKFSKLMDSDFFNWPMSYSINFRCQATGTAPLRYHWIKDSKEIRRTDLRIKTALGVLTINNLTYTDSGRYTCIATNSYGSINHTYTLKVIGKYVLVFKGGICSRGWYIHLAYSKRKKARLTSLVFFQASLCTAALIHIRPFQQLRQ